MPFIIRHLEVDSTLFDNSGVVCYLNLYWLVRVWHRVLYFIFFLNMKYTAISTPIIPSSIPNPGVPLVEVEVASGVDVGSATVPESGVATGSTAPVSPTCPSIMNVENPGVGDEYW